MDLEGKNPLFSHNKVTNQRKITGIHCHSSYELYYLRNGETKYFVGDEIFHLEPGNFIMIPKGFCTRQIARPVFTVSGCS
ncbi:MAG: AraC family ligand binding domain-containing protein [Clostridia bacterium]